MSYAESPAAQLVASHCAACNRPLVDAVSVELGMGPECRARLTADLGVTPEARAEANAIVHAVAIGEFHGADFITAIRRLEDLGFAQLAYQVWYRRRREFAPVYSASRYASGPPRVIVEVPGEPEQTNGHAEEPASSEVAPPEPPPLQLTAGQDQALEGVRALMKLPGAGAFFITGYAGSGKTTLLRVIAEDAGRPIVITPTGKAALRVREATGLEARTIHRWIYKPQEDPVTGTITFTRRNLDEIETPPSRLILLDEASMVGPDVWKDVWEICKYLDLKIVCVGDGFQLPPVQPPNAPPFSLLDPAFIEGLGAEGVELTEVLRQAQDSPVIRASMRLRAGDGIRALYELPRIETAQLAQVAVETHKIGGVVICHRNVTRFKVNIGVRASLGITDELPQPGEPLLVLKNAYDIGLYNGETTVFPGWSKPPGQPDRVYDRYKQIEEHARFGGIAVERTIDGKKSAVPATLAVEELHGRLTAGNGAIASAAGRWARTKQLFVGDNVAPHLHANFGYCYTAHRGQGSQWPYVVVLLESSIRLNEEDGRRWAYTAVTRAQTMTAVHYGNI
jgi:exodeoxyribonuclease-5